MQRFVCEQNVSHFEKLLNDATDPTLRRTLTTLLAGAKRELAIIDATQRGADSLPPKLSRNRPGNPQTILRQLNLDFDSSPHPYMILDPGPGLKIVEVNNAYASATQIDRSEIVGKPLFEAFPDNPDIASADGVSNLYASLRAVVQTGQPHAMAIQRYDVRDRAGKFIEKYWQPINTPVHDDNDRLICLLHHVEDVTDQVLNESDRILDDDSEQAADRPEQR
jgi:PAS domain-containing protein